MTIEDLEIYNMSIYLGENIWKIVIRWDNFSKDTVGRQLIRAADSISANISESYGRYHFNDTKKFLYYARGSLYETRTFITKAYHRNLISNTDFQDFEEQIIILTKKLNNYINSINKKLNSGSSN